MLVVSFNLEFYISFKLFVQCVATNTSKMKKEMLKAKYVASKRGTWKVVIGHKSTKISLINGCNALVVVVCTPFNCHF